MAHKVKNMKVKNMKKSRSIQFKVTKPVSAELKRAIVAHVKDPPTKQKVVTARVVIVAMVSTVDREATINAIKTLVNEGKLKIGTGRYPKWHDKFDLRKPFDERYLRLSGPGRGRSDKGQK